MFQKIKFYTTSTIIISLAFHILWIYDKEIDWLEGIWRVIVLLFLASLLQKNYEEQDKFSKLPKSIILILSLVTVLMVQIIYLELFL